MNDPARFTQTEPEGPEASLLRSMRSDAPGNGSKQALLGALGLGAVGGLSASAAASGLGGAAIGKWFGVVGVCGAVLGAGYFAFSAGSARTAPVLSGGIVPAQRPRAPATPTEMPQPALAKALSEATEPRAGARATLTKPATAAERHNLRSPSAHALSDEVAALERARRALNDQDGVTALKALSEYDRRFTQRALGPEAEALRIEALLGSGDQAAGKAAAQSFLARHPKSPLAGRVRSLSTEPGSSK